MPATIALLAAAALIVGFLLLVDYLTWKERDRYRRICRRARVNLYRQTGR